MLLKEVAAPWETYNTSKAGRLPIAGGISPLNSLYERSLSQPKPFNQILPVMLIYFRTRFDYTGNSLSLPRALQKQGLHAG
jgi:hypothetical protein